MSPSQVKEPTKCHNVMRKRLQVVNNKPEEKVVVSDNAWHSSGSRDLCSDMWDDDEATCGFAYDHDNNAIWDSQVRMGSRFFASNCDSIRSHRAT